MLCLDFYCKYQIFSNNSNINIYICVTEDEMQEYAILNWSGQIIPCIVWLPKYTIYKDQKLINLEGPIHGLEAIPCLDNKYLMYVVTNIFMKKYQYHHNNILMGIKYHNMFTLTYSLNKCIIPYLQVVHITILLYTNSHFVYFLCRAQTSFVRKVCIIQFFMIAAKKINWPIRGVTWPFPYKISIIVINASCFQFNSVISIQKYLTINIYWINIILKP